MLDKENEHFLYDLLGVLKADTAFFYIDADEEMPDAEEFVKKAKEFGAIPAYAYLGDVGDSVTGDKKAQKFEDDFLPELIKEIKKSALDIVEEESCQMPCGEGVFNTAYNEMVQSGMNPDDAYMKAMAIEDEILEYPIRHD